MKNRISQTKLFINKLTNLTKKMELAINNATPLEKKKNKVLLQKYASIIKVVQEGIVDIKKNLPTNENELDDPIKKRIDEWYVLRLETFISIKCWELNKINKPNYQPITFSKIELESETDFPNISIPSYSKVEVYSWAKASLTEATLDPTQVFFPDQVEILQKDFFAALEIDKKGQFKLVTSNETIENSNAEKLKEHDISLNIEYINNGESIRLQANGIAKGKTSEDAYNYQIETHKETHTSKDQILKSIAPTLKLKPKKYIPSAPITKELIFESENQAILSCDQLRTLQDWWEKLNSDLKLKIEKREAYIKITGYTTTTGDDIYNFKLGEDRAIDVGNLLASMIGRDLEGKSIADIRPNTKGEKSDDPARYVKILVIE